MLVRRFVARVAMALLAVLGAQAVPGVAAPIATAEPGPLIADSCSATVEGRPGQRVLLNPAALTDPIADVLDGLDPLGILVPQFRSTWNSSPAIPLGTVPSGGTVISGTRIADAVVGSLGRIPLLSGVVDALTPAVRAVLEVTCSLIVRDTTPTPTPTPRPAPPGTADPPPPSGPAAPGAPEAGTPPPSVVPPEYSIAGQAPQLDVPAVGIPPEGIAFNYGGNSVPQFGILGADAELLHSPRSAGSARALPAEADSLRQPLLLAVLLLALVATQLARTWLLRTRP